MNDNEGNNQQPVAGWVFKPGGAPTPAYPTATDVEVPATNQQDNGNITWVASEVVTSPKNSLWFIALGLVCASLSAAIYIVTKDVISVMAIIVLGIVVGVFAARQPRAISYELDSSGIHIGPKYYPFNSFKSFSIVPDGAYDHISLLPLKRFMPPIAVHFASDDEDKVVTAIADYLPHEEHKRDMVENFTRRVKF